MFFEIAIVRNIFSYSELFDKGAKISKVNCIRALLHIFIRASNIYQRIFFSADVLSLRMRDEFFFSLVRHEVRMRFFTYLSTLSYCNYFFNAVKM